MVLEILLITMQAARGVMLHFNFATTLAGTVLRVMAAGTGLFAIGALIVGFVLARHRLHGLIGLAITLSVPISTFVAIRAS